jgi:hypothetical protein
MANRWNIPQWLELEILTRDKHCVYCGVRFWVLHAPRQEQASWEHIVNDARIMTREINALRFARHAGGAASGGSSQRWLQRPSREGDRAPVRPCC